MSFQFGTNWPGYMLTVGNIAGPLLAYEVLTAFFLEATFLGIMLFGFNRVSSRVHTLATALVATGTTVSAFWILSLSSWMHTPAGFEIIDGAAHVTSWWDVIFSPSLGYRFAHSVTASFLTTGFLIAGISAYRFRRGDRTPAVRAVLRTGIWLAAVLTPLQIAIGDLHGLNTLQHQPAKVAAIEGLWKTMQGAPLVLFGWPDESAETNRLAVTIPKGASYILRHDADAEVKGIDAFPDAHPPVAPVFFAFRIMVGTALLMLLTSWLGAVSLVRHGEPGEKLMRAFVWMSFSGWLAVLSGWYTAEIGRQPFLVSGVLRTDAAVSTVPASSIGITLAGYLLTYAVLIYAYVSVVFYLARHAGLETTKTSEPRAYGTSPLTRNSIDAEEGHA
jgi:cytochrome d ubiquinol oxidase subunit I